ncbi:MAG TPA: hypothetical protein VFP05_08455 [Thermomicrobiales bacterium]|nr:hypothetical protein [Thermomicrobiales bacterium]
MSSRDEPRSLPLDGAALDRLWDTMQRGLVPVAGRNGSASIDAAETISLLRKHDDAPGLDRLQQDAIWRTIAAATVAPAAISAEREPNHAGIAPAVRLLQRAIRQIAIGVLGGMLVGFVVLGGGLRLLMRLAAMMTDTGGYRMVTDNGNAVGDITLGGTLSLMIFVGLPFGAMGGVVLMMVRPWLPASGCWRYVMAGAIGFAVTGSTVLDHGDNPDYQRFGILGLNVCLFTILPVLFGITVLPILDWLDGRIPRELPGRGAGWIASVAMIVLALPIVLIVPAAVGIPPVGLLLALPVVKILADRWSSHAATRPLRQQREAWGLLAGRVALAVPSLIGLLLTVQAISRLTN